jgi:hypothetical protein
MTDDELEKWLDAQLDDWDPSEDGWGPSEFNDAEWWAATLYRRA